MSLPPVDVEAVDVDVAIIGSGGAGLMAALHAAAAAPGIRLAILSKGIVGRSGCSIMAQGYNAALGPDDDPERHFADVVRAGGFLNDQELAWALASDAPGVVRELESGVGCLFDRRADGSLDLAPFPGQSRDRKVHRGHLTGVEIIGRLRDALFRIAPRELVDVRALELLRDDAGETAGVLALDIRRGIPVAVRAGAVVVAAGGGTASLYPVATASHEKSGDGLALCYRAGLELRDMEFVQFLSVGLAAGRSIVTGVLLEEGVRMAGAHLLDGSGERFMARHDPARMERAPRDDVVRACYTEIHAGRGTPDRAVLLDARPVGRAELERRFADIVARTRKAGRDLASELVPIAPAAHIGIGGVVIDPDGGTSIPGLFVAGEDAGGVHGASWQGGNGIAESTVFGARAGARAAESALGHPPGRPGAGQIADAVRRVYAPLGRPAGPRPLAIARELREVMWQEAGLVRDEPGLRSAATAIAALTERADSIAVPGPPASNPSWQEALDLRNQLLVAGIVVAAAGARRETRGMHVRTDHPARDDVRWLRTVVVRGSPDGPVVETRPVVLSRLRPEAPAP